MNEEKKIVKFVFNNPGCRNKEIMKFFISKRKNVALKTIETKINRKLSKLKESSVIIFNSDLKQQPRYCINPLIKDINKDWCLQIKDGTHKKSTHEKLLEKSFFKEAELRTRIYKPEITTILKGFGELNAEVFTSNEANTFLSNIFYSFLREVIIFNPELWEKLIKPAHFNFKFAIKCNFEKDPEIFNLINDLKEIYKKIGYIPHNINSPFHREEKIDLNNKIEKEYYVKAVYEETIRKITEEKVKTISKEIEDGSVTFLKSLKPLLKELEGIPELRDLVYIFNLFLSPPVDKLKNPTIEERKELSENVFNSLERIKNKMFSCLEIDD